MQERSQSDSSGNSFVFSLTNRDKFYLQLPNLAICNIYEEGNFCPVFGP
jgi:hypothetical protein